MRGTECVGVLALPDADSVSTLRFSSGEVIAASGWDSKARIITYSLGEPMATLKVTYTASTPAPALSSDWVGSALMVGDTKGNITLVDPEAKRASVWSGCHESGIQGIRAISAANLFVTSSWDGKLKVFDTRAGPRPVKVEELKSYPVAMDACGEMCVVAHAMTDVSVFNLRADKMFYRTSVSPLKFQLKSIAAYPDSSGFAVASIEGRCAIRWAEPAHDVGGGGGPGSKSPFAFKCHRRDEKIYSVTSVGFSPRREGIFYTAGADGHLALWSRDKRQRICDAIIPGAAAPTQAISAGHWGGKQELIAVANSYDWGAGSTMHHHWKGSNRILLFDPTKVIAEREAKGNRRAKR